MHFETYMQEQGVRNKRVKISYWRETARIFLGYLAIGLVFGFWGAVLGLLSLAGWDNWLTRILCLGLTLLTGHYVWRYSQQID